MRAESYARTVWRHVMQTAKRIDEEAEMHLASQLLSDTPQLRDEDPEFSSEPMPAAFSACLFLGLGLLSCLLFALLV
jgi:hypothetical protein